MAKKEVGRPTKYKPEYNDQAEKLCKLGATDKEIADFFEVSEDSINEWKKVYPDFSVSIKRGKIEADSVVASKLYHRAIGYEHPDTHFSNYEGEVTATPTIKHYPPDPTSMIFWLKNRQPKKWRDKQEIEHSVSEKQVMVIGGQKVEF